MKLCYILQVSSQVLTATDLVARLALDFESVLDATKHGLTRSIVFLFLTAAVGKGVLCGADALRSGGSIKRCPSSRSRM